MLQTETHIHIPRRAHLVVEVSPTGRYLVLTLSEDCGQDLRITATVEHAAQIGYALIAAVEAAREREPKASAAA